MRPRRARRSRGRSALVACGAVAAWLLGAGALRAQDPLGDAPDPFAEPAPVASVAAVDSPGGAAVESLAPAFDPDAVSLTHPAPGFELHGRANLTAALGGGDDDIDFLKDRSLELSSIDLYAQWFPTPWFGLQAEVELETEIEEDDRELEVDLELLVFEVRPLGDERLRLRLGWFPAPFGVERRYYAPPRNELATRPTSFTRLYPGDYSDLGVMLWARQPVAPWGSEVELEIALVRGLEGPRVEDRPEAFQEDSNHEPQLVGRLGWTLLDLDPGRKGDHPWAQALPTSLKLTIGTSALLGHYDRDARHRLAYVGYDAELELGGLRLRFEAVLSRAERLGPFGRDQRGAGLYALVAYHIHPDWLLLDEAFVAFRYDVLDPDRGVEGSLDVARYHWGVGWSPLPGLLLKAGWELIKPRARVDSQSQVYLEVGWSF